MSESAASTRSAGGFVVLREVTAGHWAVVGEADRRPGLPARKARQQRSKMRPAVPPGRTRRTPPYRAASGG